MARDDPGAGAPDFTPVPVRPRHDGWTPEKQSAFIEALAESACVDEACRRVGMSTQSAYALRRRVDAQSFRIAWDTALDYGVRRLSDVALSRALNGVSRPVFYRGEQIGERRYFDERLTMFLLRYRDPRRYGAWLDDCAVEQHPDGPALLLSRALDRVALDAFAEEAGRFPPRHPPFPSTRILDAEDQEERRQRRLDAAERRRERAERRREQLELDAWDALNGEPDEPSGAGKTLP
jgi:hypothetical protein